MRLGPDMLVPEERMDCSVCNRDNCEVAYTLMRGIKRNVIVFVCSAKCFLEFVETERKKSESDGLLYEDDRLNRHLKMNADELKSLDTLLTKFIDAYASKPNSYRTVLIDASEQIGGVLQDIQGLS